MCESKVVLDGEEIVKEAARITISDRKLIISDILGKKTELENCRIRKIDFMNHTTEVEKDED